MTGSLVREPEKERGEQRSHTDLFFDSIVGRPGGPVNEYAVYNRAQTVPLYLLDFWTDIRKRTSLREGSEGAHARAALPPFAWRSDHHVAEGEGEEWPFYAQKLFNRMMAEPRDDNDMVPVDIDQEVDDETSEGEDEDLVR